MILNNMNLTGNINLLKLDMAGIATIRGIKCVVIPIQENDLYVKVGTDLKAMSVKKSVGMDKRIQYDKASLRIIENVKPRKCWMLNHSLGT